MGPRDGSTMKRDYPEVQGEDEECRKGSEASLPPEKTYNHCSKRKTARALLKTFPLPWCVLWKKKTFSQGCAALFSSKSKQFLSKCPSRKNEKILLTISHSSPPPPSPILSYSQKIIKKISSYLVTIKYRQLCSSDLSCQALPAADI